MNEPCILPSPLNPILRAICLSSCLLWMTTSAFAGTYFMYGGVHTNWPVTWTAIPELNDPDDGVAENMDFVGDVIDPAGYWAKDENYMYFRMRIDAGAPGSNLLGGSLFIVIDAVGVGVTNGPLSIAWDSKENDQTKHGLEMQYSNSVANTWGASRFSDLDGASGNKISPPDFGVSNGDGYIRMIDGVGTTSFGTTTFVDIAAKWSYLQANTMLNTGQTWKIQFGSCQNANDHNLLDTDVGANSTPSTTPKVWVDMENTTHVDISDFAVIEVTVQMVKWSTASEQRSAGFYLYRLTSGRWEQVNAHLIPAQGSDEMGADYSIVDPAAIPGTTYTYKLVEIETDGTLKEYGPFLGKSTRAEPLILSQPVVAGTNGLVLRWQSRATERYTIKRALGLIEPFQPVATGILATPPENVWSDPSTHLHSAYYQIQIEP